MPEPGLERQKRHLTPALTWDTDLVVTRAEGIDAELARGIDIFEEAVSCVAHAS